jgi:endonuclease YncB( thermonuclease family)
MRSLASLLLPLALLLPLQERHPPSELYDVVKVVDADTLHVERDGKLEKLRLCSVDTEEKLLGQGNSPASKPETLYGEECARWAQAFFAEQEQDGAPPQVGLLFPGGVERRDVYGRLLCHVLLADGTDFNLLLVETGKSPYFNKYGNSEHCHADFVAAQARARAAKRGIWDPTTNRPESPDASAALRPYERLLPWWQARADAIDAFRARATAAPERHADAEKAEELERVAAACAADPALEVEVFGAIERFFDEDDGSLTVLLRSGDKERSLRARVAAGERAALEPLDLPGSLEDYRQNYWSLQGRVVRGKRGYEIAAGDPKRWTLAEPRYREAPPAPVPVEAGAGR